MVSRSPPLPQLPFRAGTSASFNGVSEVWLTSVTTATTRMKKAREEAALLLEETRDNDFAELQRILLHLTPFCSLFFADALEELEI